MYAKGLHSEGRKHVHLVIPLELQRMFALVVKVQQSTFT